MFSRERNKSTDDPRTRSFIERAKGYLLCGCCRPIQIKATQKVRLVCSTDTLSSEPMASDKRKTWTKSVSDLTVRLKQRCTPNPNPVKKEIMRDDEALKMEDLKIKSSERALIFFGKMKHFLRLNALRRPMGRFTLPITPRGFDNHKCCQHGSYVKGYDPTDGMEFYDNTCFSLDEADAAAMTAPEDNRTENTCVSGKSPGHSCSDMSVYSRGSAIAVSLNDITFCVQNEQLSERHRSYASCSLCEDDVPAYIMDMSLPDRLDEKPKFTPKFKWKNHQRTKSLPSGLHLQLALGPAMMLPEISSVA